MTSLYYKYFNGAKWILIFHQDFIKAGYVTLEEAKFCDQYENGKYSILSEMSTFAQYNNAFEFLMEYGNSDLDYIRWTQTANPIKITETASTTNETLGVVYKHNIYTNFRGLAVSNLPISTYLDGDGHDVNLYWYSIGTVKFEDQNTIPGPCLNDKQYRVNQNWLWLRVPWERTYTIRSTYYQNAFLLFLVILKK